MVVTGSRFQVLKSAKQLPEKQAVAEEPQLLEETALDSGVAAVPGWGQVDMNKCNQWCS